jgi:hypothetical protein
MCFFAIVQLCANFTIGEALIKDAQNFDENASFFQRVFEVLQTAALAVPVRNRDFLSAFARLQVGRRYKITNPDKMRSVYGKMMYLLQDARLPGMITFDPCARIQRWAAVYRSFTSSPLHLKEASPPRCESEFENRSCAVCVLWTVCMLFSKPMAHSTSCRMG